MDPWQYKQGQFVKLWGQNGRFGCTRKTMHENEYTGMSNVYRHFTCFSISLCNNAMMICTVTRIGRDMVWKTEYIFFTRDNLSGWNCLKLLQNEQYSSFHHLESTRNSSWSHIKVSFQWASNNMAGFAKCLHMESSGPPESSVKIWSWLYHSRSASSGQNTGLAN